MKVKVISNWDEIFLELQFKLQSQLHKNKKSPLQL